MSNIRRNFNRFLSRNRNKGIPKLMLWVCGGSLLVYLMFMLFQSYTLYNVFSFNAAAVARGEIWRLFTYPLTMCFEFFRDLSRFNLMEFLLMLFTFYVYYWTSNLVEGIWGRLKMNLFYLTGILMTSLISVLISLTTDIWVYTTSYYVNLSFFLVVAALMSEQKVLFYFLIPIKMRWLALLDIALVSYDIIDNIMDFSLFYDNKLVLTVVFATSALVSLLNYFLYVGRNVQNLMPYRPTGKKKKPRTVPVEPQPNPDWAKNYRGSAGQRPYHHKCTVCGRTDTECPDLEFRYCSKCKGYFCYCIDHINNHTHVQ